MGSDILFFYCPFPSIETARHSIEGLLDQRLVACGTILPGAESHYVWQGTRTTSEEVILLCKTSFPQQAAAVAYLEATHPYECPAILSFTATVNPLFAQWVDTQTGAL